MEQVDPVLLQSIFIIRELRGPARFASQNKVDSMKGTPFASPENKMAVAIKPTLLCLRILSICPIGYDAKAQAFTHHWKAFPGILNVVWFIINAYATRPLLVHLKEQLKASRYSNNTDYYTLFLTINLFYFTSLAVIATGNFVGRKQCEGKILSANTFPRRDGA